ncbi:MAG: phage tail tip fiber protein [Plesiomonas sp.]
MNSRAKLRDDKPHNSSRGKGLILETPYKPGFVDDKDLETVKMAVDKELSEISNAFYESTERTADTITRIEKLEIGGGQYDELKAEIEEVRKVSVAGDEALAQSITTLKAESEAGDATLSQEMTVVSSNLGKVEAKWGVSMNVNGKVSGVSMNNDGAESAFNVVADRFTISDGTSDTVPPFEVVGGNTRIKSAFVQALQSDNWNGVDAGWAITRDGYANFQGVTVRGNILADSGYFRGALAGSDITGTTGTFTGSLNIQDQGGNVGMKITNNQILVFDEHGRLRMRMGWLG